MFSVVPFPDMPYQICREPESEEEREKSVLVTYLGEVETKIRGKIIFTPNTDHYVLASGKNDGYGVVKAMEEIIPDERYWIVGRVVRADNIRIEEDNSFVQTLICINFASIGTSGLKHELAQLSERVEETKHQEERSIPLPNEPRLTSVPPPPKPRWWERIVDPFQMERPDLSVSYSNDTLGVVIAKHDLVKTEQLILDGNLDLNRLLLLCPEARYTCEILPSFYPSPDRPDVYASIKPLCLAIALQHYEMIRLLFAYGADFDILCLTHESPRAFLISQPISEEMKARIWNLIKMGRTAAKKEIEQEKVKKPFWDSVSDLFKGNKPQEGEDLEPVLQILSKYNISPDLQARLIDELHLSPSTAPSIRYHSLLSIGIPQKQAEQLFVEFKDLVPPPVLFEIYNPKK